MYWKPAQRYHVPSSLPNLISFTLESYTTELNLEMELAQIPLSRIQLWSRLHVWFRNSAAKRAHRRQSNWPFTEVSSRTLSTQDKPFRSTLCVTFYPLPHLVVLLLPLLERPDLVLPEVVLPLHRVLGGNSIDLKNFPKNCPKPKMSLLERIQTCQKIWQLGCVNLPFCHVCTGHPDRMLHRTWRKLSNSWFDGLTWLCLADA